MLTVISIPLIHFIFDPRKKLPLAFSLPDFSLSNKRHPGLFPAI